MTDSVNTTKERKRMPELMVELATSMDDLRESQSLRYMVFAEEMGAELHSDDEKLDSDHYDAYCHHLLVRVKETGRVVGSTRILTDENAKLAGSYYSENEFDMAGLLPLNGKAIEIGRTCIHPDFRNGITINTLWMGLAAFMDQHKVDYMFGCASIGLQDGGDTARRIMQRIRDKHLAPSRYHVEPHHLLSGAPDSCDSEERVKLPPLLNAYLRLGAWVAGEACIDEDFNVADVFILLDVTNLASRYRRHFVEGHTEKTEQTFFDAPIAAFGFA